jgi:hypothetical protein
MEESKLIIGEEYKRDHIIINKRRTYCYAICCTLILIFSTTLALSIYGLATTKCVNTCTPLCGDCNAICPTNTTECTRCCVCQVQYEIKCTTICKDELSSGQFHSAVGIILSGVFLVTIIAGIKKVLE